MGNFDLGSQFLTQVAEDQENYKHHTSNPEVLQLHLMFKGLASQMPLYCFYYFNTFKKGLLCKHITQAVHYLMKTGS